MRHSAAISLIHIFNYNLTSVIVYFCNEFMIQTRCFIMPVITECKMHAGTGAYMSSNEHVDNLYSSVHSLRTNSIYKYSCSLYIRSKAAILKYNTAYMRIIHNQSHIWTVVEIHATTNNDVHIKFIRRVSP